MLVFSYNPLYTESWLDKRARHVMFLRLCVSVWRPRVTLTLNVGYHRNRKISFLFQIRIGTGLDAHNPGASPGFLIS